jgi:hypothetical protein
MYTAPPSGDEENRTRPKFGSEDESEATEAEVEATAEGERGSPTLEPTTATTDANWTGTVPADD